jgi:hypothetical protein
MCRIYEHTCIYQNIYNMYTASNHPPPRPVHYRVYNGNNKKLPIKKNIFLNNENLFLILTNCAIVDSKETIL